MDTLDDAVRDFLAQERIAVAGVSRNGKSEAANAIYRKLRSAGHSVFAVNPKADEAEGDPCYRDLASIPGGVDAVVAATPAGATADVVRDCSELGIERVWIHRSFGRGSLSSKAVEAGEKLGVRVIAGACPMMYCEPIDPAHRCMRWFLRVTGRLPRPKPLA